MNASNKAGVTPLHKACIFGQIACVKKCVDMGADIGATDGEGNKPLHYAARCGFGTICNFLINAGCDKEASNNDGNSAADVATGAAKGEF